MRPLLLALSLATLAGCGPRSASPPPQVLWPEYRAALLDGDADRAIGFLEQAADAGDLSALAELATIRERGYAAAPYRSDRKAAFHLPVRSLPWDALLAARRYELALEAGVRQGDEDALFLVADRMLSRRFAKGEWSSEAIDRDSAQATYRRLAARDADPLRLAFLAHRLDDDHAYRRHLEAAADAGDPQACVFLMYDRQDPSVTSSVVSQIDGYETCRQRAAESDRDAPLFDYADQTVTTLAREARAGNSGAAALLDSLRTLGVFERHPRLAPLAEGA